MKKNKTKSLLACAVLASVLAGGMPCVQASEGAFVGPKDYSALYGKTVTFGQKFGDVNNQQLTIHNQKPTWQIVAGDSGSLTLLAKESWGVNRYSEALRHVDKTDMFSFTQRFYSEVLQLLDNKKGEFFTPEELALLSNQSSCENRFEKDAVIGQHYRSDYTGIFALPVKQAVENLTEEQRKRNEIYWLNDANFVEKPLGGVYEDFYYSVSTVETDGRLTEHCGEEKHNFYPTIKVQLLFAYCGDKQIGQSFKKQMTDSSETVHLAVKNTQTERNVQIRALEIAPDKIKFTAEGLATGTGQGLAGILADNAGNYLSYARLKDTSSNSRVENVTITDGSSKFIDNSKFAAGDYTVQLFNEKLNTDSCFDYVGNFEKLPQVSVDANGAITKATLSGNRNFTNLAIGENVAFDFKAVNYAGGKKHGNAWSVVSEAVKVTDSLKWANVLNAEGSITLKGSFSVANDTLTLVRPTNKPSNTFPQFFGVDRNDIIYDGTGNQTATLHVNGKMYGLIVNGGTFTAEKNLTLDNYLKINNGAKVEVKGKLNVPNSEITGTLQIDNDVDFNGTWHVNSNNKIIAPKLNVKSTLKLEQDAVVEGICNIMDKSTLVVVSNCFIKELNFADGSTLRVDGNKIQDKAAITYTTDVHVDTKATLTINNQKKGVNYKIFQKAPALLMSSGPLLGSPVPNETEVYAENIEDWEEIVRSSYGLALDLAGSVFSDEELTLCFEEDPNLSSYSDMSNIVSGLLNEPEGMAWIEDLSFMLALLPETDAEMYLEMLNNSVNTLANINTLANVQAGVSAISSFAGNSIQSNIGTGSRPMLGNRGQVSGFRKVSANEKDRAAIETVEQGKASEVMPTQYEEQKYGKEVWASFIHNKEKIEGRKTGHLEQNSTMQYNGTVVGADLWSGKHGFGGVALTYGSSNTHSGQMISNVKNEADYYGINVYNRQDVGKFSFLYDGGFTYGRNDVTMSTLGEEDTTAKPKVRAYTLGLKVEEPIRIGGATELTPFVGARYTLVKTKEYQNSLGLGYDVDNQHLINMPVGLTIKGMYETKQGWKLGGTLTGGYCWNLGSREGRQKVSFGGYSDMIDFDIADKGEYFIRPTLLAEKENLTFEVGYNYSKGKTTRSNKWYVNANIGF